MKRKTPKTLTLSCTVIVVISLLLWLGACGTDGGDGGVSGPELGAWTVSSTTFSPSLNAHASEASSASPDGYLYILGGDDFSGIEYQDEQHIKLSDTDGSLVGSWVTDATSMSPARTALSAVVAGGCLIIIGGQDDSAVPVILNTVEYATIGAGGTLGAWNVGDILNTPSRDHASVAYNGYLYVIGGSNAGSLTRIEYSPDTPPFNWQTTTALPIAISNCSAVAWDGYLYVIGGIGNETNVRFVKINANGTLDTSWQTASLGVTRERHSSVVNNGYLYVIGGTADAGATSLNTVRYAQIVSGTPPTLGAWQTTAPLVNGVYAHTSVIYNGYIYVAGGADLSLPGLRNSVQFAPFVN